MSHLAIAGSIFAASLSGAPMRREGGTASKVITVSMSIIAFVVARLWTGVF